MFNVEDKVFRTYIASQWGVAEEELTSVAILGSLPNLRQFLNSDGVIVLQQVYRVRVIFANPVELNGNVTLENSKYIWLDVPVVTE